MKNIKTIQHTAKIFNGVGIDGFSADTIKSNKDLSEAVKDTIKSKKLSSVRTSYSKKLEKLRIDEEKKVSMLRQQKIKLLSNADNEEQKRKIRENIKTKINAVKAQYSKLRENLKNWKENKISTLNESEDFSLDSESMEYESEFFIPPCIWDNEKFGHTDNEKISKWKSYSRDINIKVIEKSGKKYLKISGDMNIIEKAFNDISGDIEWDYVAKKLGNNSDEIQELEYYMEYRYQK